MIRVTHLTKRFGRFKAVDDLSFTVEPGEAVALWGSNGAGKTTVIRCLLGLLSFSGTISVAAHDVRRQGKAARRRIGYVPQELALYDDLRLTEALRFFARLKRAPLDRAPIVLADVGLVEHRGKRIRELSGGMKQRLALAIALLTDPPLLVLDELTSNLDAEAQRTFMDLLRRLRGAGKTVLFTSHHLNEVEGLADRVLVMAGGRLQFERPPQELAEAIGARCLLHVFLEQSRLDEAQGVLRQRGFAVTRNGEALHVVVTPGAKAGPIQALGEARIAVRDFQVLDGTKEEPSPGAVTHD